MFQLIKVKISPVRKLVFLTFTGNLYFPISLDDYYRLRPQQFDHQLTHLSLYHLLRDYSLRQLALSPKSTFTLSLKLKKHYYQLLRHYHYHQPPVPNDLIRQIIDNLSSQHLLDDREYANFMVNKHQRKSARHIIFLLHQAGVNYSTCSDCLSTLHQQDRAKIIKLLPKIAHLPPPKQFSWFIRRGFREDSVKSVIDETVVNR